MELKIAQKYRCVQEEIVNKWINKWIKQWKGYYKGVAFSIFSKGNTTDKLSVARQTRVKFDDDTEFHGKRYGCYLGSTSQILKESRNIQC